MTGTREPAVEVSLAPMTAADDSELVGEIVDLVNNVYLVAEDGLWLPGMLRTDGADVAASLRDRELGLARVSGRLVGCIRVVRIDDGLAEFGLLAASPEHRGRGVGRALVAFAEDWARSRGLGRMQLELLTPIGATHPTKLFLHDWYIRCGYLPVRHVDLGERYPQLPPELAMPCDLVVFHKDLDEGRT